METDTSQAEGDAQVPQRTRFRFKSSAGQPYPQPHASGRDDRKHRHCRHHHHHHRHHQHHHHHHHRRHHGERSSSNKHSLDDDQPAMSVDDAFRESLFDALADDEGASYWEALYSQPIHNYERQWVADDNDGLRQMTDDEYAAYVRTEMWKRTREGMLEEQEERRRKMASWRKEQERAEKVKAERNVFDKLMEESLQRGRARQSRKKEVEVWSEAWKGYLLGWEKLNEQVANATARQGPSENQQHFRNMVFWPVRSGKRQDITAKAVEEFLQNAPAVRIAGGDKSRESQEFLSLLKTERVRWHPDKVQHRYGGLDVGQQTIQSVTEVFQIIDCLWNEARERAG